MSSSATCDSVFKTTMKLYRGNPHKKAPNTGSFGCEVPKLTTDSVHDSVLIKWMMLSTRSYYWNF